MSSFDTIEVASEINKTMGGRLAIGARGLRENILNNGFRKLADIWASLLEKRTITSRNKCLTSL